MGGEIHNGKLILYGVGDLVTDLGGRCYIPGDGKKKGQEKPNCRPAMAREQLGALWYADVNPSDGTLQQLILSPTRQK